jgi:uncharacterized protein
LKENGRSLPFIHRIDDSLFGVRRSWQSTREMEDVYRERGRTQPVCWQDYPEPALELARKRDQPLFLVSGTTWSGRCRQLDKEAFSQVETGAFIDDHFIPVRIDRDELPDVDSRLQRAVHTISGERGWPLIVFLTPEKRLFFGGTYYPKDAGPDRPSFTRLLETVAMTWREERERVNAAALSLEKALQQRTICRLSAGLVQQGLNILALCYDSENGGFQEAYGKRLWPGALELLLATARTGGRGEFCSMVEKTLIHMGRGAVFDQIGGGFHHRTHDAGWLVPSFEKLLCDNAEMLRLYLLAYEATGNSFFSETATSTIDYLFRELCDLECGGFYASQSADEEYYTWTTADVMRAVPADFVKAVGHHFHFRPGVKNVPYRALEAGPIAERFSQEPETVIEQRIGRGREFLRSFRERRPPPFVDRRIFAGWNARASEAFDLAGRVLGRRDCAEFAERTRKRIEGQDRLAIFDEVEDGFGPSRMGLAIEKYSEACIENLGPAHGSLLHALLTSRDYA